MSSLSLRATVSSSAQPAGVHAVVVGQQDAHAAAYGGTGPKLQLATRRTRDIAPYSQQLGDFFTGLPSVLVKRLAAYL